LLPVYIFYTFVEKYSMRTLAYLIAIHLFSIAGFSQVMNIEPNHYQTRTDFVRNTNEVFRFSIQLIIPLFTGVPGIIQRKSAFIHVTLERRAFQMNGIIIPIILQRTSGIRHIMSITLI